MINDFKLNLIILIKRKVSAPLFNNLYTVKVYKWNEVINNDLILKQIKKVKAID